MHEVRAKVLKFVPPGNDSDSEGKSPGGGGGAKKEKSPWSLKGVGPLRVLKHKETGTVRILLRTEPGGNVALNRALLPSVDYKLQGPKYVHLMTADDKGTGLETWMVQVKTKEIAEELVAVLQREKVHNKK